MDKDKEISSKYTEEFVEANKEEFEEIFQNSQIDAEEYLKDLGGKPRNWFPAKVGRLYQNGFGRMGIIASNIYAESVMDFWLGTLNRFRENNNLISEKEQEELQNLSYSDKLDIFRQLGIIEDPLYGTLKRLNTARNKFAHDIESHDPKNETEIEKEVSEEEIVRMIDTLFETYQEGFIEWVENSLSSR